MTRVRVSPEADEDARRIDEWWRENRPDSPELFVEELADVFVLLASSPFAGRRYPSKVAGVRRVHLRATRHHVYYRVEGDDVVILRVWGSIKERGPRLH